MGAALSDKSGSGQIFIASRENLGSATLNQAAGGRKSLCTVPTTSSLIKSLI